MFVKYDKDNSKVTRGPQLIKGDGDGWLPFLEGESFVINSKTQTSRYALSDDQKQHFRPDGCVFCLCKERKRHLP